MADNARKQIFYYRTDTAGNEPIATDMEYGEIAINYAAGAETILLRNTEDEIGSIPNRNTVVATNMTSSGSIPIPPMTEGETLRLIVHNTSSSPITASISGGIVVHRNSEILIKADGYASFDVVSSSEGNFVSILDYSTLSADMDVCLYDKTNNNLIIVSKDDWNYSDFPSSGYSPVGVVAVPASHGMYSNGAYGVVSLVETTTAWGDNEVDTALPNYTEVAITGPTNYPGTGTSISGVSDTAYLPSDNFSVAQCPADSAAYYNYSSMSYAAAPSPYIDGGDSNSAYTSTESPSSALNALSDFNGMVNTNTLLSLDSDSPAATYCNSLSTDGTKSGDWYFPSCGEFGYVVARQKAINNTISALITAYGSSIGSTIASSYYWTSTEHSDYSARLVGTINGEIAYYISSGKAGSHNTRAFIQLIEGTGDDGEPPIDDDPPLDPPTGDDDDDDESTAPPVGVDPPAEDDDEPPAGDDDDDTPPDEGKHSSGDDDLPTDDD